MWRKSFNNPVSAGELVEALLKLSIRKPVCLLDSCGISYLGSRYLIAGIEPLETFEISGRTAQETLRRLDEQFSRPGLFTFFTLSYEFGLRLENIRPSVKKNILFEEPDVFLAVFDTLILYDYVENKAFLLGNEDRFADIESQIEKERTAIISGSALSSPDNSLSKTKITSNFTRSEYLRKIADIQELIRCGQTYQVNLTQQFHTELAQELTPQIIFRRLREKNPTPFSAFVQRINSTVISASPERFFKVYRPDQENRNQDSHLQNPFISTSPIKGTRRRGLTETEDAQLREELLHSEKDRAENVMIVDLLRNDLGRICRYGQVSVEKLCELETHPTLFHLVSTISGELNDGIKFSEILKAVYPCGSITGAPKISTMQIIDRLETALRGLSMGAVGISMPDVVFQTDGRDFRMPALFDLSVAIRTITVHDSEAIFNVGGGIVIDSIGEDEYEETLTKAKALFKALNIDF